MALTDDQRAMIRLLAQREEGYEDIAALMGLSVGEVRKRVREALAELNSEATVADPVAGEGARRVGASSTPPSPAPPAEETAEAKGDGSAATNLMAGASSGERSETDAGRPRLALTGLKLPKDRGASIGLGAGAVAVIALIVVLALSGGDSNSTSTTTASTSAEPAGVENKELTQAVLSPVNGGGATGRALFGRFKKGVVLVVAAKGLEPSPQGQSYAISLSRSPTQRVPIAATKVNKSGAIAAQFRIPSNVLGLLANGYEEMEVSLVSNASLRDALTKAQSEGKPLAFSGTNVLRGKVTGPIVNAGSG